MVKAGQGSFLNDKNSTKQSDINVNTQEIIQEEPLVEEMQDSNSYVDQQSKHTNDLAELNNDFSDNNSRRHGAINEFENFNNDYKPDIPSFVEQNNNQDEEFRSNPSQDDNIEVEPAKIEEVSEEEKFYAERDIN